MCCSSILDIISPYFDQPISDGGASPDGLNPISEEPAAAVKSAPEPKSTVRMSEHGLVECEPDCIRLGAFGDLVVQRVSKERPLTA